MSDDMVEISVGARLTSNDDVDCEVEHLVGLPRKEWEAMTPDQRQAKLSELAKALVDSYVTSWAVPVGDQ